MISAQTRVVAIVGSILAAGAGSWSPGPAEAAEATAVVPAIVKESRPGIVTRTEDGRPSRHAPASPATEHSSASGIVLTQRGDVLTAAHAVENCTQITVTIQSSSGSQAVVQAGLVQSRPDDDLALIRTIEPWSGGTARLRQGTPRLGEEVVVAGFALPGLLASSLHITTGIVSTTEGPGDDVRMMGLSAPVQLGNSGGPVLDRYGNVVGVVMGKLDSLSLAQVTGALAADVSFAVQGEVAQDFLRKARVPFDNGQDGAARSSVDLAALARTFTVRVDCWSQAVAMSDKR